jgi:hypothetical protein
MSTAEPGNNGNSKNRNTKWIVALFVAALLGVTGWSLTSNLARERQKEAQMQGRLERLEIASSGGARVFQVEVMRTAEEKARGLMFRQFLPEERGMLFDFGRNEPVSMWMRNTYIPLDMLFIRSDGVVHHIHERAQPLDETPISSRGDVRFVLEVNGGVAAKFGLKAGDRVSHALIAR